MTTKNRTLIEEAREAIQRSEGESSEANWIIGRCAADWGGTDGEFAAEVNTTRVRVGHARRVYVRFAETRQRWQLPWTYFFAVVTAENADQLLTAAADGTVTLADLRTPAKKSELHLDTVKRALARWQALWPRTSLLELADAMAEVELTIRREIEYRQHLPPPPP